MKYIEACDAQNFRLDMILDELGSHEKRILIKIYVTISHVANKKRMRKVEEKEDCTLAGSQPSVQWASCSSCKWCNNN